MHERLPDPPPLLDDLEREVIMGAAARDAEKVGIRAPFNLRPGLIAEIVRLYDELARYYHVDPAAWQANEASITAGAAVVSTPRGARSRRPRRRR